MECASLCFLLRLRYVFLRKKDILSSVQISCRRHKFQIVLPESAEQVWFGQFLSEKLYPELLLLIGFP